MTEETDPTTPPPGDLAQFVEETLVQIMQGIVGAQLRVDTFGAQVNPVGDLDSGKDGTVLRARVAENRLAYIEKVEFDVAVTRTAEEASGAGGGIRVMGIGVGGKLESADSTTRVSRLKFSVPVIFPGDPNPAAEAELEERRRRLNESRRQSRRVISSGYLHR